LEIKLKNQMKKGNKRKSQTECECRWEWLLIALYYKLLVKLTIN